ncbi:putative L-gulonolactone oxidase 6 [Abeliophyllum distichum]|uniref:L-gulonolactone oxidase 6 n=1 Tax=Abeliophyllum distichum TaxID=126358 RepID=A0ABD1PC27_9LAMI
MVHTITFEVTALRNHPIQTMGSELLGRKCIFFIMIICMVNCSPPEDPIKCTFQNSNCTITNTYGAFPDRSICRAAKVVYPSTEEELILAVANATMSNTKMKVATRFLA